MTAKKLAALTLLALCVCAVAPAQDDAKRTASNLVALPVSATPGTNGT